MIWAVAVQVDFEEFHSAVLIHGFVDLWRQSLHFAFGSNQAERGEVGGDVGHGGHRWRWL